MRRAPLAPFFLSSAAAALLLSPEPGDCLADDPHRDKGNPDQTQGGPEQKEQRHCDGEGEDIGPAKAERPGPGF